MFLTWDCFALLCREEIEGFMADGTLTHLNVAFSQLERSPTLSDASGSVVREVTARYVQEAMMERWRELGRWVMEDDAVIYVCG